MKESQADCRDSAHDVLVFNGEIDMNHKRKRPKNKRAGCLMCKPNKMNGINPDSIFNGGIGPSGGMRSAKLIHYSNSDLRELNK